MRPAILLLILFSILTFLVGFRTGKKVERFDKTYVPPTAFPSPTPESPTDIPIKLKTFDSTSCGVSFLYPATMKQTAPASTEARLENSSQSITLSCDQKKILAEEKTLSKQKARSETVAGQTIKVYQKETGVDWWKILSPTTGRGIMFENSSDLTQLILRTLTFK